MNLDITEENKMICKMAKQFADEVIAPRAEELERNGNFPYDIMNQMADLGMMGIPFPEKYGGSGGDWVGMHLCLEELSRGDISLAGCLEDTTCVVANEIFSFGTEEQKEKWLVPLIQGKKLGAFALTEPGSGSDAKALKTTAIMRDGKWVLNGTKQFITNIGLDNAWIALVAAISGRNPRGNIISAFIVPKNLPGFRVGKKYNKLGWHVSDVNEVVLEDCCIPYDCLLGDPSRGFSQHLTVLETGRISIAAMCVGLARACFDQALRYSKQRVQFGKEIFNFQIIQFKLSDMAVSIELGRNMYLKAAWLKDQGRKHTFEASAAKLYCSEMVEKAASDAVQIHGGYGYIDEYPVSRYYKAAKLLQIIEGTSEVQRMIIGRILAKVK